MENNKKPQLAENTNTKIKIGYKEYQIIKQPEIEEVTGTYYGTTKINEERITISTKYSQKIQNQTLIHELLHCIADKYDLPIINNDEHSIQLLAVGIYEAIIDNPHIFKMNDI